MARFFIPGIALSLLALAACTPAAESAQQAGVTVRSSMQDNAAAWRNLFEYSPEDKRPALPQTRYCYQMQADIVCFDSPQANMTAKLAGYQDGNSISWVQPGGGALGVSGGEPTAQHDAQTVQIAPATGGMVAPAETMSTMSAAPAPAIASSDLPGSTPFATGESPYVSPPQ